MTKQQKYCLVALDVDGTLLSSRREIAPATKRAIREAMEHGVHITLATGRAYPLAKVFAHSLKLRIPLVTHDGAFVADPESNQIIFTKRIPYPIVAKITDILGKHELDIMVLHEAFAVTNRRPNWQELLRLIRFSSLRYIWKDKYPFRFMSTGQLVSYVNHHQISPPKIFVTGPAGPLQQARAEVDKQFAEQVRTTRSGEVFLEILPRDISKASGLAILGNQLEIAPEEMIAIGDYFNDVEMIRMAGLGVAMGNAPEEVRMQADFVTRSNDEDGVAHVIRQFILGQS